MPRLMKVFGTCLWVWDDGWSRVIGILLLVLGDDLFDAPLHHAEILLGVDMFSLTLTLHVLHLTDITLILLLTLQTVVDTGGRSRWFSKQILEME